MRSARTIRSVSTTLRPTFNGHDAANTILRLRSRMKVARNATFSLSSKTPYARARLPSGSASRRVADSAELARPSKMAVHVVDADADDGGVLGGEFLQRFVEAGDFGRTDERKIARIEKDQNQLGGNLRETAACGTPIKSAFEIERRSRIARLQHRNNCKNLLNLEGERNRRRHSDLAGFDRRRDIGRHRHCPCPYESESAALAIPSSL